jgi:hypothetical protein
VGSTLSVTSREWVAAFYAILAIAVVGMLGIHLVTALVILLIVVLTLLASRACSVGEYSYWTGLRAVASINPTGETFLGQVFVLPALVLASIYSWVLGIAWLFGARAWPQKRWVSFLRGCRAVALRVRPKA